MEQATSDSIHIAYWEKI